MNKIKSQIPVLFFIIAILADIAFPQLMNWRKLNIGSVDHVVVSASGNLFATSAYDRKLYKSADDGDTWTTQISNREIETIEPVGIDTLIFSTLDRKLYFSFDGGATYSLNNTFNSRIYTIRYIDFVDSSLVLLGTANGFVYISKDFGNTWTSQQVSAEYVYSLRLIQTRIYASTNKGLFYSDNYGLTWSIMIIVAPDEPVFDIAIDSMNNLYVSADYDVYKSSDSGNSWTMSLDQLVFSIQYSPEGELFAGEYKSTNQGLIWGKTIPTSVDDFSFKDSLTFMVSFDGGLYREELNPYYGYNYFPLTIGNVWQYKRDVVSSWFMGNSRSYTLRKITVVSDTLISGKAYFKIDNGGITEFYRYDSNNVLYIWNDFTETVFMDFNLIWGETFQYFNITAGVQEGFLNIFGNERHYKGFGYSSYNSATSKRFIDSVGFWSEIRNSWDIHNYSSTTTISLIDALININELSFYYSNYYKPQIIFTPITSTDTLILNLGFNVTHQFSNFSTSGSSRNFIKDVWIQYFYARPDSATIKDSIICEISGTSSNCSASIFLDSLKFEDGFKFYYAIYARDKALIPQISRSPETDYYELTYNPDPLGVGEEQEKLFSFKLEQNYPNPFNPSTKIKFTIPVGTQRAVSLRIYDVLGNEIATLVNEEKPAGEYEVEFDGSNLTSGIYFYKLQAGEFTETKKMVLLR